MNKTEAANRVFHVARVDGGNAPHAFDLRRKDDGGLSISRITEAPSDAERTALYVHFGSPMRTRSGREEDGRMIETFVTYQPGTPEHFLAAVHRLPAPFMIVAPSETR